MKTPSCMVNYGIALTLFGILFFSLMAQSEGFTVKKKRVSISKSKGDRKTKVEPATKPKTKPTSPEGFDSSILTKEEAEKLVNKLIESNKKANDLS